MLYEDYIKREKLKKQYCVTGNCLCCFYSRLCLACPLTEINSKFVVGCVENKMKYNIPFACFPISNYFYKSIHIAEDKLRDRYKNKIFISGRIQWEGVETLYKDYHLLVSHLAEFDLLSLHKGDDFYIIKWSDKLWK